MGEDSQEKKRTNMVILKCYVPSGGYLFPSTITNLLDPTLRTHTMPCLYSQPGFDGATKPGTKYQR